MASVSSASPAGYYLHQGDSDSDWDYVQSGGAPSSVGLASSPGAGSMHSWGIVGFQNHHSQQPSPPALSPRNLDSDQQALMDSSFPERHPPPSPLGAVSGDLAVQFMTNLDTGMPGEGLDMDQQFVFEQDLFNAQAFGEPVDTSDLFANLSNDFANFTDFTNLDMSSQHQQQPLDLGIPQQFREENNVPPWDPTNLKIEDFSGTSSDGSEYLSQSPLHFTPSPKSHSGSPGPLEAKPESGKAPNPIRKTKSGKVEKSKAATSKFVIMTPTLINAQSGRPNPFECFEAMRVTQRGRKGPLANDTKENALQVRRLGACFCCHARKVKCQMTRPCKNCTKLTIQVPQIVCWQFHDFLPVLFPDFIRGHFKKEHMSLWLSDHIQDFTIRGTEQSCSVEFFSGRQFQSTLTVPASFFTPKTAEVLQHWHLNPGAYQIDIQSRGSVPIGVDPGNSLQREELKRRSREYIHNLTFEPMYAEQVTDAIRTTHVPRRILKIVQKYAQKSNVGSLWEPKGFLFN